MEGGAGADAFDGGTGVNTVSFEHSTMGVTASVSGSGQEGDALGDTYKNIQNVRGGSGPDLLAGDAGNNIIEGGGGGDLIFGNGGTDFVSYIHSNLGVQINLTSSGQADSGTEAYGDILDGIEGIYGSTHDDGLLGDGANNIIYGYGGADDVLADAGNNVVVIRSTPANVDGGVGTDKLTIERNCSVRLDDENFAEFEAVAVGDGSTVDMSGVTSFTGRIVSASKAGGHVTITGSKGKDSIFAGAGSDTFMETMANFGRDKFVDVDLTRDTFELSSAFAADTTAAHLHFVAYKGSNTVVYGDAGKSGANLITLTGVDVATAEAHRSAFVIPQVA